MTAPMIQKRFLNSKSVAAKDILVALGGARRGWRMLHDGPLIVEESKIQGTRDGLRHPDHGAMERVGRDLSYVE